MPDGLRAALEFLLLVAGYALVDLAIRREGFLRLASKLGWSRSHAALSAWFVLCAALLPFLSWNRIAYAGPERLLAAGLALILAWQAATRDIDPVLGEPRTFLRMLAPLLAAGTWFHPACLPAIAFLLTTPFGIWQHHAAFPMRLLQALTAHALLAASGWPANGPAWLPGWISGWLSGRFRDASALALFVMTIAISHYFITALAKGMLGPKWHSWATENRMHHLAACAYSWGWARFLPWKTWLQAVKLLSRCERPLQASAFLLELLSPLAFWHPRAAIGFCLGFALFHLGVFAVAGLLFWDWILADLLLAAFVAGIASDPGMSAAAFGPGPVLAGLAFMAAFPLRHKLWKPMPLGWYDTPFTQRIHWRVRGRSGRLYGLYNDFMCPHERLYGKVNGCFLAPVPVVTYHLGEVWKPELRAALVAAGPDPARLDAVKDRFGIRPVCADRSARHLAYLKRFFHELNRGARKYALPRPLRWLKAPGDQIFYWGDLTPYRRQEPVSEVTLHYREEYFDGAELRRIRDEEVARIAIDGEVPPARREATPKEIDDFLLGHAAGRLIDLPGFGGGYVRGDDGQAGVLR